MKVWSKYLFYSILLLFSVSSRSQSNDSTTISFLFAGDLMGHMPQVYYAYDSSTGKYDYTPCFQFVKPYIDSVDVAIANLEVTLAGEPYSGYPMFSSPDGLAESVKKTGFDILVTANNHSYDKGKRGFERTLNVLDTLAIPHLGTYKNISERDKQVPFIVNQKGFRIALFNYTYGTNGITPEPPNIVDLINYKQMAQDLRKADSLKVDYKIVILHWGLEYELVPNKEQKKIAQFLAQHGCNAIIGSHPHVSQTYELLYPNKKDSSVVVPVFYSLGNFISNQRDRYKDGAAMYRLTLTKDSVTRMLSSAYVPYWVYKGSLKGKTQFYLIPPKQYLDNSDAFKLPVEADIRLKEFYTDIKKQFPNLPEYGVASGNNTKEVDKYEVKESPNQ